MTLLQETLADGFKNYAVRLAAAGKVTAPKSRVSRSAASASASGDLHGDLSCVFPKRSFPGAIRQSAITFTAMKNVSARKINASSAASRPSEDLARKLSQKSPLTGCGNPVENSVDAAAPETGLLKLGQDGYGPLGLCIRWLFQTRGF